MACALLLGACGAVNAQWWTGGNTILTTTEYLGCDALSTQPLRLKTVANQPIDFSTSDIFRARINKREMTRTKRFRPWRIEYDSGSVDQ